MSLYCVIIPRLHYYFCYCFKITSLPVLLFQYYVITCVIVSILHHCAVLIPDYMCANRHDGILLPHPEDCHRFVECFHNTGYIKECGSSLHFNPRKGICDYKDAARCTAGECDPGYDPGYDLGYDLGYALGLSRV